MHRIINFMKFVQNMHLLLFCAFLIFSSSISGTTSYNLCLNPSADLWQVSVYEHAIPSGGKHAGKYHKDVHAHSVRSCVRSCCKQSNCNVAFLFGSKCFLISCVSEADCRPKFVTNKKRNKSAVTVLVRGLPDDVYNVESHKPGTIMCEIGLGQCPVHQICQNRRGSRARHGKCVCKKGYIYESKENDCIKLNDKLNAGITKHLLHDTTSSLKQPHTGSTTSTDQELNSTYTSLPQKSLSSQKPTSLKPFTSTTEVLTTTPTPITKLAVSAGKNKTVQLPKNSVSLTAYVLPAAKKGQKYHYEWVPLSLPAQSDQVYMTNQNTEVLELSNLIAGVYVFKLKVSGVNKYGEATVNVTVLPLKRVNKHPVAVITPLKQNVTLPKTGLLDGSKSTDDDGIATYHWEQVSGPLLSKPVNKLGTPLILKNLIPGKYVFKLTVTDKDGASNSTLANVFVFKEIDNPPKAVVSSDVVITLPQNSVTLLGNGSYDDHGIVSYKWSPKFGSSFSGDMKGAQSAFLHLSNLQQGSFTFVLEVTDKSHQTDKTEVTVIVKPAKNQPPVANAGKDQTLYLPFDAITLDGRNSSDDRRISKYHWLLTSDSVTDLTIAQKDQALTKATGNIIPGRYTFLLTVTDDENLTAKKSVTYTVKETNNKAPVANAGGNQVVQLPVTLFSLNGSKSFDDRGIVSYLWTRNDESLAAGDIVKNSHHSPVLCLSNLIAGHYKFTLTVKDAAGLRNSDTVSLTVRAEREQKNLLEIMLDTSLATFTEANRKNLLVQLEMLIHKDLAPDEVLLKITKLTSNIQNGRLVIQFLVMRNSAGKKMAESGTRVLSILRSKLGSQSNVLDYRILELDTVVCQNNCSGHGHCDQDTKLCVCQSYWMPNIFLANYGLKHSNCDWSVLYVVIVSVSCLVVLIIISWLVFYFTRKNRRCCRGKTKRTHYSLLRNADDDNDEIEMSNHLNNGLKIQRSSLMVSDSDLTSDEDDTVYVNQKKPKGMNGVINKNNVTKSKNKIKA